MLENRPNIRRLMRFLGQNALDQAGLVGVLRITQRHIMQDRGERQFLQSLWVAVTEKIGGFLVDLAKADPDNMYD